MYVGLGVLGGICAVALLVYALQNARYYLRN